MSKMLKELYCVCILKFSRLYSSKIWTHTLQVSMKRRNQINVKCAWRVLCAGLYSKTTLTLIKRALKDATNIKKYKLTKACLLFLSPFHLHNKSLLNSTVLFLLLYTWLFIHIFWNEHTLPIFIAWINNLIVKFAGKGLDLYLVWRDKLHMLMS